MSRLLVLVITATLLGSYASKGNMGDYIPEWAGGLPKNAPLGDALAAILTSAGSELGKRLLDAMGLGPG
jgi:hypothetical protein